MAGEGFVAMSRRRALKSLGLAAAAGAVVSVTPFPMPSRHAARRTDPSPSLQVGVLLPRSRLYPGLGQNFLDGMALALASPAKWPAEKATNLAPRWFGIDSGTLLGHARALSEAGVDVLVGMVSPRMVRLLQPILEKSRTPLIVAEAGAGAVHPLEESPLVFYHSLGYWQSNWAIGAWLARNLGKRAYLAAAFYEVGFDALSAFRLGLESAGGELAGMGVTHGLMDADWDRLFQQIRAARPDVVFSLASTRFAVDFLRAFASSREVDGIPLVASGFAVDEAVLSQVGDSALGIRSCLPWAPGLDNALNHSFMGAFRQDFGRSADAFAVLGFDTARLISEAAKSVSGSNVSRHLADTLAGVSVASPRGTLALATDSRSASTPLYLREVRRIGDRFENVVVDEIADLATIDRLGRTLRHGKRGGWVDSYLAL